MESAFGVTKHGYGDALDSTKLLSETITMRIKGIMQTTIDVGSRGIKTGKAR